jgi:CBS domain-containing protein
MLKVRELMRMDPYTLEPDQTLREAVDGLVTAGTGGAPVVSAGKLVGVVSLSDILAFEADAPGVASYRPSAGPDDDEAMDEKEAEEQPGRWFREMWDSSSSDVLARVSATDRPEWDELDEHAVEEVMTRRVVEISPDATIQEAAHMMDRAGLHRLVVTELGSVVGVLGARDIVRAVATGKLVPARSA